VITGNNQIYQNFKEKAKEVGYRYFSDDNRWSHLSAGEVKGIVFYDDDDLVMLLNYDLATEEKIKTTALLTAHAISFLGKDFKMDLMVLNEGCLLMQKLDGKREGYNIPNLYKAHLCEVASALMDSVLTERSNDGINLDP